MLKCNVPSYLFFDDLENIFVIKAVTTESNEEFEQFLKLILILKNCTIVYTKTLIHT
jgi:hypothetical protein